MKAVILAGGKGTRLKPYTTSFPKPLMPVGDKPILELLLVNLKEYGIKDVTIAVGHLSELIISYFGDGSKLGINITYSKEEKPMGTAGPLKLVKKNLKETFIVLNGDIISDVNFSNLFSQHNNSGKLATVSLSERKVNIDYGVVKISNEDLITDWSEKPSIRYLVSMGIYIFEPQSLKYLSSDEYVDIPDFLKSIKEKGGGVNTYKHSGYWLDIGREEDYSKACEDLG